jgi:hypothetical protein
MSEVMLAEVQFIRDIDVKFATERIGYHLARGSVPPCRRQQSLPCHIQIPGLLCETRCDCVNLLEVCTALA